MPDELERAETDRGQQRTERRRPVWTMVGVWILIAMPFVVALIALTATALVPGPGPRADRAAHPRRREQPPAAHRAARPNRQPGRAGEPSRAAELLVALAVLQGLRRHLVGDAGRDDVASTWSRSASCSGWPGGGAAPACVLGVGAVLAVLLRFYGPEILTQAWNPYMPLAWWLVFIVAVWSPAVRRRRDAPGRGLRRHVLRADAHLATWAWCSGSAGSRSSRSSGPRTCAGRTASSGPG